MPALSALVLIFPVKAVNHSGDMDTYGKDVKRASEWIQGRSATRPSIGIVTGTGLAESMASLNVETDFDYREIPCFPVSTVQSHAGKLVCGKLDHRDVVVLQGRFHLYEGYCAKAVAFPIRVLKDLGVETLVLTNAAGGLKETFRPGDLMLIEDHINLTGENPLVGPNDDRWGVRFPDMSTVYHPRLRKALHHAAVAQGIPLQRGVYAGLKGPSLETPAEIRFLKTIGADAVGLSTVMEAIAAVHSGMTVLGVSTITNIHRPKRPQTSSLEEIIAVAASAAARLDMLIHCLVQRL